MTLSDYIIYCTLFAPIILAMALYAIVERGKLAGLSSGIWLALRALVWVALLAVWAPVVAALIGIGFSGTEAASGGLFSGLSLEVGGAAVALCIAIAVTLVSAYLYRNLWQLGAVQPRLRRRADR